MMAKAMHHGCKMLLGVTGGIGSGKTTVANMLGAKGARIVDFDLLARKVVEPGTGGFDNIVGYFGTQVVAEDGTLDRKRLSKIVFNDVEKRKKLEAFTHPAIFKAFFTRVKAISAAEPDSVILVVIPLLVELNLQYLFDRLMVVYVPRDVQIRRLARRDNITADEAAVILKAQIPIDEKLKFADFVVDNAGTLEETREQVEGLWKALNKVNVAK
ncbi:CoaE [Desulforapulum autotrophicum HRM2]|uniref:Dephospho-CoA kinase n=1 Tax=Desulforapulum autotrophicum (strain ATCC 43914 / DSM 3382 / VKM B-1955 / HRM2) TaxID=177437 RepID=C0QLG0_DESAH|nr:dephospho-CoA kinase [Desulforapulum autotrophicum]ACN16264.1 CoaE [Desulforapulum autotrophicum HRM2]